VPGVFTAAVVYKPGEAGWCSFVWLVALSTHSPNEHLLSKIAIFRTASAL